MKKAAFYVYLVHNVMDGTLYVGWTVNPKERWGQHLRHAIRGQLQRHLYNAIRHHGPQNFQFDVLETWPSESEAQEAETWLIAYLRSIGARLYNMTDGGEGALGWQPSEETRALWLRQRTGKIASAETRAKMSKARKGRSLPEEQRKKISESQRGRSGCWKGRTRPPEFGEQVRQANFERWARTDRSHTLLARVLAAMSDGEVHSVRHLAEALGEVARVETLMATLSQLTSDGRVQRVGRGRYKVHAAVA